MKILIIFLFFFFLPISTAQAHLSFAQQNLGRQVNKPLDVVINEIAWMGTKIHHNDEWIELYNNTNSLINVDGWILKAADGSPKINLIGMIPPKDFYLLERTNDDTLSEIPANQFYAGALENNGEILKLYDNFNNLIDKVDCSAGWFAGDNITKQTMERKNSLLASDTNNWATSEKTGGTAKTENSVAIQASDKVSGTAPLTVVPVPLSDVAPLTVIPTPLMVYAAGIVINEILPSPEGPDAEEEYIEIFNENNFEVDISDWQITDTIGKTKNYTFPKKTIIKPQGFLKFSRPTTKITLNNKEDGLMLIHPDRNITDRVNYKNAPHGQSYNRILLESNPLAGQTDISWLWSPFLTPGFSNITSSPEIKEKPLENDLPEALIIKPKQEIKQEIAVADKQNLRVFPPLPVSIIALASAAFSGIIILFLKKRIKTD